MTHNRGKRKSKRDIAIQSTLKLIQSLKELEEKGALHINRETREIHLIREMFWDKKDWKWRLNFAKNCHFLMERHQETKSDLPVHIYAIDLEKRQQGDYITSFLPAISDFKPILG